MEKRIVVVGQEFINHALVKLYMDNFSIHVLLSDKFVSLLPTIDLHYVCVFQTSM